MAEAIAIRLGDEELMHLAHALKVRAIPGVRSALLDALDPDHFALAMAVADRSLRARGLVQWLSQDEREYEPLAAAVVRAMAAPRFSAVLDLREGNAAATLDYVFAGQSVVEHTTPEPGVHQFVIMDAAADLVQRLGNLLHAEQAPASTGHARLPRTCRVPSSPTWRVRRRRTAKWPNRRSRRIWGQPTRPHSASRWPRR